MEQRDILIAFYSRSGVTRAIAEWLAKRLDADLEEVRDARQRKGLLGYWRCRFDAIFERPTKLRPLRRDPSAYQMVVIGTPVWDARVSVPVRMYLDSRHGRFSRVAFFLTDDEGREAHVFSQMRQLSGRDPIATLELSRHQVGLRKVEPQLEAFVNAIKKATSNSTDSLRAASW